MCFWSHSCTDRLLVLLSSPDCIFTLLYPFIYFCSCPDYVLMLVHLHLLWILLLGCPNHVYSYCIALLYRNYLDCVYYCALTMCFPFRYFLTKCVFSYLTISLALFLLPYMSELCVCFYLSSYTDIVFLLVELPWQCVFASVATLTKWPRYLFTLMPCDFVSCCPWLLLK